MKSSPHRRASIARSNIFRMIVVLLCAGVASCSDSSFSGQSGTMPKRKPVDREPTKERPFESEVEVANGTDLEGRPKSKRKKNKPPEIISSPLTKHEPGELLQDPEKFDMRNWQQVNFNTDCGDSNPVWTIEEDYAYEHYNAEASALVSDIDSVGVQIEGTFSVSNGAGDDDYIGILFGYQDTGHSYLFDWKQAEQGQQPGMCLQILDFQRPIQDCDLFLGRNGYAGENVKVINCANRIPWQVGVEYTYVLNFRPGVIDIQVKQGDTVLEHIVEEDDTYTTGKFGLYANSQDGAAFGAPTIAPVRGDDYEYQVEAEDPEGDDMKFELIEGPDGMVIDEESGLLFWPATEKEMGRFSVVIRVEDEHGGADEQSFDLTIEE